ncbi:hypothetical protein Rhopal_003809-T1 [Rhodotorula paludigena]|uniref:Uncharacterized protein n=1 Tax=Rhodotorula paludigena TaxID=86838 RepID=A0AAV5GMQ6_9BASI|nr:hypothetical protein Rhopal_003809-T1 [Rhodotorula paludigena]
MERMQLDVREDELFTSLSAVRDLVAKRTLRPLCLLSSSARSDFPASSPPFDSVVVGLAPTAFEYSKLNEAFRLLAGEEGEGTKGEVPLIVTHKARPFITALEEAAGCQAEIVGKPSKAFFQLALDSLASHDLSNDEIGMTGKYRPGDEDKLEHKPEWVGRDFAAAVDAMLAEAA